MSIIKRSRTAQYPLVAEFVWNFNDGMAPLASLAGASIELDPKAGVTDFGSKAKPTGVLSGVTYTANDNGSTKYFEVLSLPVNAQIISGELIVEEPYVGPSTATIALGDVNSGNLLLAATSLIAGALGNGCTVSTVTNATAGNPNLVKLTASGSNHLVVVGDIIQVSGCTGASAVYNGSHVVDVVSGADISFTIGGSPAASITVAGAPAAVYTHTPRVAFGTPGQETNQGGASYGSVVAEGSEAAKGADIRATMAMSGGQAATAGRVRIRVMYTIDGRANEVSTT